MTSLERRVAIDVARAARHLLESGLPGSRRIAYEGGPTNLVTEMDARAEELIVGRLAAAFPGDAVHGEEHDGPVRSGGWERLAWLAARSARRLLGAGAGPLA